MTDRGIPRPDPAAAAEVVATAVAAALGLGDRAEATTEWPVEDGDTVLRATVSGDATGTIVLGVNDDVAARLAAQPDTLAAAFAAAVGALGSRFGITVECGPAAPGAPDAPAAIALIFDGGQLTAVAGLDLDVLAGDDGDDDLDDEPVTAGRFEPAAFDHEPVSAPVNGTALSVLNDVDMIVTAELGRTTMPMRELLGLTPGMVVEIDRAAGAPIDLLVNGRRIATGEVVVIDEEFGIRITEIVPGPDSRR